MANTKEMLHKPRPGPGLALAQALARRDGFKGKHRDGLNKTYRRDPAQRSPETALKKNISALSATRVFVSVLLLLARQYELVLQISRDSSTDRLLQAYRKVLRKVHPDKGG